jgi:hypothetical protein
VSRHFTSPSGASGGATEQVGAWRLNLFKIKIVVYGFLTPYTKCGLQHRGKPLRVDVVVALLTGSKATFLDTTECRTGVSKLVKFTAEITNRVNRDPPAARIEPSATGPIP